MLNNILSRVQGNLIKDVTFCNTENGPVADGEKESYLDILCQDQSDHYFKEAFKALEQNLWNTEERRAYQKSLDALNKDIRLQAGIFEEGFEDGLQKGKEVIARNALGEGLTIHLVTKFTGLSVEEVTNIAKTIKK